MNVRGAGIGVHGAHKRSREAHVVRGFEIAQRVLNEDRRAWIDATNLVETLVGDALRLRRSAV